MLADGSTRDEALGCELEGLIAVFRLVMRQLGGDVQLPLLEGDDLDAGRNDRAAW